MYRIELAPGEETVFRSIEELAVAIKRGIVTPRARIYHNASSKWLPIQFHPHYKTAVSMPLTQAALVAGAPVKPLSSLILQQPTDPERLPAPVAAPPRTFAGPVATPVAFAGPLPTPVATPVEQPIRKKKQTRAEQPSPGRRTRRSTKSQRQLRIALVGALLLGGAQWVLSVPLFSRTEAPAFLRTQRRFVITAPANTAAMVPVIRTPSAPAGAASFGSVPAPAPARMPQPPAATPQPATPLVETAATPEIEPAPSTIDVSVPAVPRADSLASKMADSANKKAINGILRAVSGAPAKEKTPAKR